jgi:hypothetical protein
MEKPKPPIGRRINDWIAPPMCNVCGSSMKRKWFGLKTLGCIHPKCTNYYKKNAS